MKPISRLFLFSSAVPAARLACCIVLVTCGAMVSGCTGDSPAPDRTAMLPENERVSSVPWNKPSGWENTNQLGALANNPRIGGGGQQ